MRAQYVEFSGKGKVELRNVDLPEPQSDQILIKTKYSAISPGTERAMLLAERNTVTRDKGFPFRPGYSTIGEVIKAGSDVNNFEVGDIVATIQTHSSHMLLPAILGPGPAPEKYKHMFSMAVTPASAIPSPHHVWKLPRATQDATQKASAGFGIWVVGMHGVRMARIELGETVVVIGLGPVGLSAAVQAKLAGAYPVIGIDRSAVRRAMAEKFDIDVILSDPSDLARGHAMMMTTEPPVVIEATGRADVIPVAFQLCANQGRVVLLSSTRESTEQIDFYADVHRKGLVLLGAHESVRPLYDNRPGYWTAWDDRELVLRLIRSGRIDAGKLISTEFPVQQISDAYQAIIETQDALSVLLKW
jgi:threonine dehydrogenase-like Zn-dependent dehydrogenase